MFDEMKSDYYFLWLWLRRQIILAIWALGLMSKYQLRYLNEAYRRDYQIWKFQRKEIYGFDQYGRRYR